MPMEKMSLEDVIVGKMERVTAFARSLYNKTYGEGFEGGRNRMGKVVVFNVNFASFLESMRQLTVPWAKVEQYRVIRWLDALIDISNTSDEFWESFWAGNQPYKPDEYWITILVDGKEVKELLKDVKNITILDN